MIKILNSCICLGVALMQTALSDDDPLVVGMELEYPPFEFVNEQGSDDGVSVQMAKALAKDLDRTLEIKNIKFDALITALKTGSIDLIIWRKDAGNISTLATGYLVLGLGDVIACKKAGVVVFAGSSAFSYELRYLSLDRNPSKIFL